MRIFFFLVLLAGIGLGIAYPWAAANLAGNEIATLELDRSASGFEPAEAALDPSEAPVRVHVEMTAPRFQPSEEGRVLTLTASTGGRTVLAETLDFAGESPRQESPQASEATYRDLAGMIDPVDGDVYIFTAGPGDAEGVEIGAVRIVLRSGGLPLDPRAPPVGYALIAIGFIGFVLALMRGRRPKNPNSQPPRPRWGRGASG